MFGRKRLIEENLQLKDKIEILENDIKYYEEKENDKKNGKRVPDVACKGCKYLIEERNGFYVDRYCVLDSECNDKVLAE